MAYKTQWKNDPDINQNEKNKLKKDGLDVFKEIDEMAQLDFAEIPKEYYMYFKYAGLTVQKPQEKGLFMLRIKLPGGILTSQQAQVIAAIGEKYGDGIIDITTRQSVQYHFIPLKDLPRIFAELKEVQLTTSEAEGDTPRNIVSNPLAGLDPYELFDTRPLVQEVNDYLQDNRLFSNLPRKFKISISSNIYNSGNAQIQDLAFVPATKVKNKQRVQGFHVYVGGGLGVRPQLAQRLNLFVLPEQVLAVTIAVLEIYRDEGYRHSRGKARMKFLIADIGIEKFQEYLRQKLGVFPKCGRNELKGWDNGQVTGVHKQKQQGLHYAGVSVPVGRITSGDFATFGLLAEKYGSGELRIDHNQNLFIPNIPKETLSQLLSDSIFSNYQIAQSYSLTSTAMTCTGNQYCNMALTNTKDTLKNLLTFLEERLTLDVPVRIIMTGCPNSCGHQNIADIGLRGTRIKGGNQEMLEGYEVFIGGTLLSAGEFNKKLNGKIPTAQLGSVVLALLNYFKSKKKTNESFYAFVRRVELSNFQMILEKVLTEEGVRNR